MEQKNNLADQAIERQKIIQDTWYKAQMLRYYTDELKYKVQASQDEVKKAEITQKYNDAKLGADVMNNAYKIAEKQGGKAAQDYLMGVQQQSPQLFSSIMSSGFGDKLSKLQPSGSERLAGSAAELVQRQLGGRGQDGAGQPGQMPGGAGPTNEGRAGAVGGGIIPQITAGGVTMAFPEAQAELARTTKRVELSEAMRSSSAPALSMIDQLEKNWNKAFPKAPEKGLGRIPYGVGKSAEAFSQSNPDVASYLQTRLAFLSLITRGLGEKGVLTNVDIERVNKAIPTQFTSRAVSKLNFQTIRQIIAGGIQKYLQSGGDPSVIENVLGPGGTSTGLGGFTIKEIK